MDMIINVKNMSKALKPKKGNIIMYDGKDWYVTTKDELFKDYTLHLEKCKEELTKIRKDNSEFKADVAKQLLEMSEIIRKLISKE